MVRSALARRWASAIAIGVAFGVPMPNAPAVAAPADDGSLVYCLGHRADLVRAAIALDPARAGAGPEVIHFGGSDLTVEQWRSARPADFDRTCKALRASTAAGGSPNTNFLITAGTALFAAAVGAGFTWLVTSGRERAARRRQAAQDLAVSARAFNSAVRLYLLGWRDRSPQSPARDGVVERMVDLEARLRRVQLARPKWPEPGKLLAELGAEPFGSDLVDHEKWTATHPDKRPSRVGAITVRLDKFTRDAEHVAYRYEHLRRRAHVTAETG